jgi:hypothetical protein
MQVEQIIAYIHSQRYNGQFLLTCHFSFLGNSENKQQRLEAFVIMHIAQLGSTNMQNMHNISANMP